MMLDQTLVGARVRQLRLINGHSSTEMAGKLEISAGSMSMLENGRLSLTEDLLDQLSGLLHCASEFFSMPDAEQISTVPWLRAYADAPKRSVQRVLNDNALAVEMINHLQLPRIADAIPLFDASLEDDEAIETAAGDARTAAGLDDGDVVRNAVRAAERLGCVVLPLEDELGRHLGMSQRIDNVPVIRVARSSEDPERAVPGDRERFTVLHEVGHLALHHDRRPPDTPAQANAYEKQAHRFAAAFLAPADAVLADLAELGDRVTLNTLAHLKQRWGLSIKAFVVRFRHLGIIDEAHARSLYKQISARGYTKVEPVFVPRENAQWLSKALASKFGKQDPIGAAVKMSGLGQEYFKSWCDWSPTPIGDLADVVVLHTTPTNDPANDDGDGGFGIAPVTRLGIRGRR
jgi:Zn-dependent peptidase ImmA (M78 family)/transcriptional regulator with XRE-family HTH domain